MIQRQAARPPALRVAGAAKLFRAAVQDLIESTPTASLQSVFDNAFPRSRSLNVRGAQLAMLNAAVSWLAADLKANASKEKRAHG